MHTALFPSGGNRVLHHLTRALKSFRLLSAPAVAFMWLGLAALPAAAQTTADLLVYTNLTVGGVNTLMVVGYTGSESQVSLPSVHNGYAVTAIGGQAFLNCSSITSITIPASITNIGINPFSGCTNLWSISVASDNPAYYTGDDGVLLNRSKTSLIQFPAGLAASYTIPSGVTKVGQCAFYQAVNLVSVTIPTTVTNVGDSAFYQCAQLTNVVVSDGVTTIGSKAFFDCSSLAGISIPNSVTNLGTCVFQECSSLTSFSFPSRVMNIGAYMFSGCTNLSSVTILNNVTNISDYAFEDCSSLTSLTLPNSILSLGYEVFYGCSRLGSVTLPNKLTTLGSYTFLGCTNLNSVTLSPAMTSISDYAFAGCVSLKSMILPSPMVSVGNYAFSGCTSLITFSATNNLKTLGSGAFSGCSSLPKVVLPSKLAAIQDNTFSGCSNLASISIPSSVQSIGNYAFSSCVSLTNVSIPSKVKSMGNNVFAGCSLLRSITIPASVRTLGDAVFVDCISLTNAVISAKISSLGDQAFSGCVSLTSATIPSSVKSFGDSAFSGCLSLTSVTIPASITNLGSGVFMDCSGLTALTFGNNVKAIGDYSFSGCSSLTAVTLPSKITTTANYTFQNCSSLTSVVIPNNVTTIGMYAFAGCSHLTSVSIPSTVQAINEGAFANCTSLVSLIIPSKVNEIDYQAFSGDRILTNVFFAGNVPSTVGNDLFNNAPSVTVYYCTNTTGWDSTLSERPTTMLTAPFVYLSPTNQNVLAGSKATFSVGAFGPLSLSYQWRLNGMNISGAKSSTLTISSAQAKNAGFYDVLVANRYGSTLSAPAQLTVQALSGNYRGLVTATNAFDNTNSGAFILTISSGGAFSSKLTFPAQTLSGSGKFALSPGSTNIATASFPIQLGAHSVEVVYVVTIGSNTTVSGSLTAQGQPDALAQISGAQVAPATNTALFNTALFSTSTNGPTGYSYGSIALGKSGVTLNLTLADEKAVLKAVASGRLVNNTIPVFGVLYSQKGFVSGWLTIFNEQILSQTNLTWHKEPAASSSFFSSGFNQGLTLQGGLYTPVSDLSAWGTNSLFLDAAPVADSTVFFDQSSYIKKAISIPVSSDLSTNAPWTLTASSGLVTLSAGTLKGSGILVPDTAPYPGIYGFATNALNGLGAVHALGAQPQANP